MRNYLGLMVKTLICAVLLFAPHLLGPNFGKSRWVRIVGFLGLFTVTVSLVLQYPQLQTEHYTRMRELVLRGNAFIAGVMAGLMIAFVTKKKEK